MNANKSPPLSNTTRTSFFSNIGQPISPEVHRRLSQNQDRALFLRNLPYHFRDEHLMALVSSILDGRDREIELCRVKYCREDGIGKPMQVGYALLSTREIAQEVLDKLEQNPRHGGRDIRGSWFNKNVEMKESHEGEVYYTFEANTMATRVTEEVVRSHMEHAFGPLRSITIRAHFWKPSTNEQSGFGFLSFEDELLNTQARESPVVTAEFVKYLFSEVRQSKSRDESRRYLSGPVGVSSTGSGRGRQQQSGFAAAGTHGSHNSADEPLMTVLHPVYPPRLKPAVSRVVVSTGGDSGYSSLGAYHPSSLPPPTTSTMSYLPPTAAPTQLSSRYAMSMLIQEPHSFPDHSYSHPSAHIYPVPAPTAPSSASVFVHGSSVAVSSASAMNTHSRSWIPLSSPLPHPSDSYQGVGIHEVSSRPVSNAGRYPSRYVVYEVFDGGEGYGDMTPSSYGPWPAQQHHQYQQPQYQQYLQPTTMHGDSASASLNMPSPRPPQSYQQFPASMPMISNQPLSMNTMTQSGAAIRGDIDTPSTMYEHTHTNDGSQPSGGGEDKSNEDVNG